MEGIGRGRLFIGALKLLSLPPLRTDSDIAAMGKLGFDCEVSFSVSKNKYSPSPAFLICWQWVSLFLLCINQSLNSIYVCKPKKMVKMW